jgi:hypothetical protein
MSPIDRVKKTKTDALVKECILRPIPAEESRKRAPADSHAAFAAVASDAHGQVEGTRPPDIPQIVHHIGQDV